MSLDPNLAPLTSRQHRATAARAGIILPAKLCFPGGRDLAKSWTVYESFAKLGFPRLCSPPLGSTALCWVELLCMRFSGSTALSVRQGARPN